MTPPKHRDPHHIGKQNRYTAIRAATPEPDAETALQTQHEHDRTRRVRKEVVHTASGSGGLFAVELSWAGMTIRLAVADSGAPTGPVLRQHGPDTLEEAGRGLDVVASLCDSYGTDGDHRGRVVWAHFRSAARQAAAAGAVPLAPQPVIEEGAALLARQYAGWHTWFGPWTRQWWALPRHATRAAPLITASSARALASRLDAIQGDPRHAGPGLRSPLR
jgi:hypothetical protein